MAVRSLWEGARRRMRIWNGLAGRGAQLGKDLFVRRLLAGNSNNRIASGVPTVAGGRGQLAAPAFNAKVGNKLLHPAADLLPISRRDSLFHRAIREQRFASPVSVISPDSSTQPPMRVLQRQLCVLAQPAGSW